MLTPRSILNSVGLSLAQQRDNLAEGVAREVHRASGEDAEAHDEFHLEACPAVVAVEAEGLVVGEGGHLDGVPLEAFQFGELRYVDGVERLGAPAGEHLVEGAVGFDLDEEVVEFLT